MNACRNALCDLALLANARLCSFTISHAADCHEKLFERLFETPESCLLLRWVVLLEEMGESSLEIFMPETPKYGGSVENGEI